MADERDGNHIFYSLNKTALDKFQRKLLKICACGSELGKQRLTKEPKEVLYTCTSRMENELKQLKKRITELEKEKR